MSRLIEIFLTLAVMTVAGVVALLGVGFFAYVVAYWVAT
jgi:hypothetical protein